MSESNANFQPMKRRSRADVAIEKIDEFFATEALLTEEDKLRDGLRWGVEHGFLSPDEALHLERMGHIALINGIGDAVS